MQIVLFEPEIPPNTGNVARLCAATKTELHLIEPLGFRIDDKHLKRAGLDYWPHVQVSVWPDFATFRTGPGARGRMVLTSARQGISVGKFPFLPDDILVFGPETRGLPEDILTISDFHVRIPIWGAVRSLNLSTAVGIVLYQAFIISGVLEEHV